MRRWRSHWPVRLEEPAAIHRVLRSPAYRDRAFLEVALSRYLFAPFVHQEVSEGPRFERRARFSAAAMAVTDDLDIAGAVAQGLMRVGRGPVPDLLDEVRQTVIATMVPLIFGDRALEPLVLAAVRDFDARIKLQRPTSLETRRHLAQALSERLRDPAQWPKGSCLGQARDVAVQCGLKERVDHVASVFLGTGVIQVTDLVTHGLIALSQRPQVAGFEADVLLREVLRRFPVNASVTRRPTEPRCPRSSEERTQSISVVPERANRYGWSQPEHFDPSRFERESGYLFGFGTGPRACPARKIAWTLSMGLLDGYRGLGVQVEAGYRHRRSLALPARAVIGEGPVTATSLWQRSRQWLGYVLTAMGTYPTALIQQWRATRTLETQEWGGDEVSSTSNSASTH